MLPQRTAKKQVEKDFNSLRSVFRYTCFTPYAACVVPAGGAGCCEIMISNLLPQRWWSLLVGEKQISGSRVLRETVQCADFNGTATTQGGRRTLLMSRASLLPPILPQFPSSQAGWFFTQHHEEHFTSSPLPPVSSFPSFPLHVLPFCGEALLALDHQIMGWSYRAGVTRCYNERVCGVVQGCKYCLQLILMLLVVKKVYK